MKALLLMALAGLMIAVPASAQEDCPEYQRDTPEGCAQQAWVDDCPPDMMCAASAEEPVDSGTHRDDGPTYGDCGGEVCAYDAPVDNGTGSPQAPDFSTCMDGADPGEDCDGAIYYMTPVSDTASAHEPTPENAAKRSKDASLGGHAFAGLAIIAGAMVARRHA